MLKKYKVKVSDMLGDHVSATLIMLMWLLPLPSEIEMALALNTDIIFTEIILQDISSIS